MKGFEMLNSGKERAPRIFMPEEIKNMVDPGKKRTEAEKAVAELQAVLDGGVTAENGKEALEAARKKRDSEATH